MNVRPINMIDNSAHVCFGNPKLYGERLAQFPIATATPDFVNIRICKFGEWVLFTSRQRKRMSLRAVPYTPCARFGMFVRTVFISRARPSLRNHILGIILARSEKQMRGVAARGIVTLVKHKNSPRLNGTVGEYPRGTVGIHQRSIQDKSAVVGLATNSSPFPAFVRVPNFDLHPESVELIQFDHKKSARQSKCACASSGSLPNGKSGAGSCSTGARNMERSLHSAN